METALLCNDLNVRFIKETDRIGIKRLTRC